MKGSLFDRFVDKVLVGDDCWGWLGRRNQLGYGRISVNGTLTQAHRVSWGLFRGPIPDGMCVCHSCDNRGCVKPGHLFLGTQKDNMRDCMAKGRFPDLHGEANPRARLTWDDVDAIRASDETGVAIAERYGVSKSCIYMLRRGRNWKSGE